MIFQLMPNADKRGSARFQGLKSASHSVPRNEDVFSRSLVGACSRGAFPSFQSSKN